MNTGKIEKGEEGERIEELGREKKKVNKTN